MDCAASAGRLAALLWRKRMNMQTSAQVEPLCGPPPAVSKAWQARELLCPSCNRPWLHFL